MTTADVLLVIDMQNGVCFEDGNIYDYDGLVERINDAIEAYHKENKAIIFIQHDDEGLVRGTEAFDVVKDISTELGTHKIYKTHGNAFYHTKLQQVLDELEVKSLEICGAETPFCVDATVKFAHGLGYKLYMKRNMTSTNYNDIMTPEESVKFYEMIWDRRFVEFID
ncbi:isochorismatase family protein [Macrococcoides bohemicum]|uniref:isochorismatase family protein n=1 Tax=Macrococcoides bohemicum TaxID=1903056 RepID=UPI001059F27F|nr:isochorismatase family protein [Macrococcus bohemicus]TDL38293.1 isochorismatase family protein [Macrococcus bohemicus]